MSEFSSMLARLERLVDVMRDRFAPVLGEYLLAPADLLDLFPIEKP
jgi:hypothetical protein